MQNKSQVSWNEIYQHWKIYAHSGPVILNSPINLKEIHVDFPEHEGIFYGYDWLTRSEYMHRKELIEKDLVQFLYFTKPTNKGTMQTLQMLMEAKDDEERATIWIYAFAKELSDRASGSTLRFAYQLCDASLEFLSKRFYLWHHAMKKLVPEIYIDYSVYAETAFSSVNVIIDLARLNAALVLHEYVPILYTSLKPGERKADYTVRWES